MDLNPAHQDLRLRPESEIIAAWARLGIGFNVPGAATVSRVEDLLVATAAHLAGNSRLFVMVATWLHEYSSFVDGRALAQRAALLPRGDVGAALALLIDVGVPTAHHDRFAAILDSTPRAEHARPLFDVMCSPDALAQRTERNSVGAGRRWKLWIEPFEFKPDALRSREWILENNPQLRACI